MRSLVSFALLIAAAVPSMAQDAKPAPAAPPLESVMDKANYAIGLNIGRDLSARGLDVKPAVLVRGIADAISGADPALTEEEMDAVFRELSAAIEAKQKAAGLNFLKENGAKEGVKVTESGLQYLVIKPGNGANPVAASKVSVHYRGKKIDGSVFDQSFDGDAPAAADEPVEFGLNQVIKGWTEGLQLMKPGAHYRLFISSELAYGAQAPPSIGPHQVLVFDVYLLTVAGE